MLLSFDNAESKRDLWGCWVFSLQRQRQVGCCWSVCVLALRWTHTAVIERSLFLIQALVRHGGCFSSPAAVPVNLQSQPFSSKKMPELSDWLTSAQPRSGFYARGRMVDRVVVPRHAGIICSSNDGTLPTRGSGGSYCLHPGCWAPQKSSYNPQLIFILKLIQTQLMTTPANKQDWDL